MPLAITVDGKILIGHVVFIFQLAMTIRANFTLMRRIDWSEMISLKSHPQLPNAL